MKRRFEDPILPIFVNFLISAIMLPARLFGVPTRFAKRALSRPFSTSICRLESASSTSSPRRPLLKKLLIATPVFGLAYYATLVTTTPKMSAQQVFETKPHALDDKNFVKFTLKRIEELSDNVKQYTFALPNDHVLGLPTASLLMVRATSEHTGLS